LPWLLSAPGLRRLALEAAVIISTGLRHPSGRASCPTEAVFEVDHLKNTPETAEPVGVSPPEAVRLLLIEERRNDVIN
jgi:hypothetical protein